MRLLGHQPIGQNNKAIIIIDNTNIKKRPISQTLLKHLNLSIYIANPVNVMRKLLSRITSYIQLRTINKMQFFVCLFVCLFPFLCLFVSCVGVCGGVCGGVFVFCLSVCLFLFLFFNCHNCLANHIKNDYCHPTNDGSVKYCRVSSHHPFLKQNISKNVFHHVA